jgi:hypothetical protein
MIFGYTKFLEREIERLNSRIESLEARNQELIIKMFSRPGSYQPTDEKPPQKHIMVKGDTKATCSCGWIHISDDPAILQTAISSHYRDATTIQRGRKSWPQAKAALERASSEEKK